MSRPIAASGSSCAARARAGRQPWREEPLGRSFRSAKPILDVVDAVFADREARDGVVSGPDWPRARVLPDDAHPAWSRSGRWSRCEPAARAEDWQLPDQQEASLRGETRLARAIARQIFEWRRDAVPLASTGRPIRAGDVMVLLPRRGILQELLIRELKRLQVPVAGADRLALTDEIAVMDLMALGDALLLPEDDLTLAAVLRSPLFGLSEEQLFELAHDRGDATLIERLRDVPGRRRALRRGLRALFRAPGPGGLRAALRVLCPAAWARAAAAGACSSASGRRRPSRSRRSSPRRSPTSRAIRPRCRASCTGCGRMRPS